MADAKELKPCPCGKTPDRLGISDGGQGGKYHFVAGDCCSEWMIEFRANYKPLESDECMALAIAAWNASPRAATPPADAALADEIEWPEYHSQGMGCGIEDRGITDRYEACAYGFQEAVDQCAQAFDNWIQTHYLPEIAARPQAVAEDTALLDWLDKQREDMVQNNNREPELYAHAWGVYGRCNTVREAIRDEMLAASKAATGDA